MENILRICSIRGSLPFSQKHATTPIVSQTNSVYYLTLFSFQIHFIPVMPSTSRYLNFIFPSGFLTKILTRFLKLL